MFYVQRSSTGHVETVPYSTRERYDKFVRASERIGRPLELLGAFEDLRVAKSLEYSLASPEYLAKRFARSPLEMEIEVLRRVLAEATVAGDDKLHRTATRAIAVLEETVERIPQWGR